jgi:hypothetical protein
MQYEFNYWYEAWEQNWAESFRFLVSNGWVYENQDNTWFNYASV